MRPDDEMRAYVQKYRTDPKADVRDLFIDAFSLEDDEGTALFERLWADVEAAPSRPAPKRCSGSPAPQGRSPSRQDPVAPYLNAPYRFVALNETIVFPEEAVELAWKERTLRSAPLPEGLSGRIEIRITFDGPLLIGAASGGGNAVRPLQLGERFVIPGATLRGLARSTLEIAAFARLHQTNLHRRYGIRDFSHELFRDDGRDEIRAGWLRPARDDEAGRYVIEPCAWHPIDVRSLPLGGAEPNRAHLNWLKTNLQERYAKVGMRADRLFDFDRPRSFSKRGTKLVPDEVGGFSGVYVFSDRSPTTGRLAPEDLDAPNNAHKKTEAVFAAVSDEAPLPVPAAVWKTFQANNSTPSRNRPEPVGNWKLLQPTLNEGRRIPVFWVSDGADGVQDFGLVRVFKRAHRQTVEDVLKKTGDGVHLVDPDRVCPDFVDALFGFVHEPERRGPSEASRHLDRHLKGRVAFGFAWLDPAIPAQVRAEAISTVMSTPKPSFGPFYLESRANKDWSDADARLAGRKRYPARGADLPQIEAWLKAVQGNANERTLSKLHFLVPRHADTPLAFKGAIKVHNVTPVEAGALLWALTFGNDDAKRHLIGRAKTAGAGQARIAIEALHIAPNRGGPVPSPSDLFAAFARHMIARVPGWPKVRPVEELLKMADPAVGRRLAAKLGYLELRQHAQLRGLVYDRDAPPEVNRAHPRLLPADGEV